MEKNRFAVAGLILSGILFLLLTAFPSTTAAGDFCWKHTKGRGVGTIPDECGEGKVLQGAYCFDKCPANHDNGDFLCWERCPASFKAKGWRDDPMHCAKPAVEVIDHAGFPWRFGHRVFDLDEAKGECLNSPEGKERGCEQLGLIWYPKCAADKTRIALACSPKCPSGFRDIGVSCEKPNINREATRDETGCGEGNENDAGLCYPKCETVPGLNRGYDGVGPVCWQKCPTSHPFACGMGCAEDEAACARGVTDQVLSVFELAATVAFTLVAPGAGAGAQKILKKVKEGTENAMTVANIAATGAFEGPGAALVASTEAGLGKAFSRLTKNIDDDQIAETIKKAVTDNAISAGKELPMETLKQIGPLSAGIEDAAGGGDFDLGLLASMDPTGIMSVVDSFNKPVCANSLADIDTGAEEQVSRNAWSRSEEWDSSTGSVWIVGDGPEGRRASKWSRDFFEFQGTLLNPISVAVEGSGRAWIVDANGGIYGCSPKGDGCWLEKGGPMARDIAVSVDGQLWITGPNDEIHYRSPIWDDEKKDFVDQWRQLKGKGQKISVDAKGDVWVTRRIKDGGTIEHHVFDTLEIWRLEKEVNSKGEIVEKKWIPYPGQALNFGVGGNGQVWKLGPHPAYIYDKKTKKIEEEYGNSIHFWDEKTKKWIMVYGRGGVRIDVDSAGQPWVVDEKGAIHFLQGGAKGIQWFKDDKNNIQFYESGTGKGTRIDYDPEAPKFEADSDEMAFRKCELSPLGRLRGGCVKVTWAVIPKARKYAGGLWRTLPGKAKDIAIGWPSKEPSPEIPLKDPLENKEAWMASRTGLLHYWDENQNKWRQTDKKEKGHVAVSPKGDAWYLDNDGHNGRIRKRVGGGWVDMVGHYIDFSIGADGKVWGIARYGEMVTGGRSIFYGGDAPKDWKLMKGGAMKIAAPRRRGKNAWVVNSYGQIFYLKGAPPGGTWIDRSTDATGIKQTASDIAVVDDSLSSDDSLDVMWRFEGKPGRPDEVWIIDGKPGQPGGNIWVLHNEQWKSVDKKGLGLLASITADLDGNVWVVNQEREIYYRDGGYKGRWLKAEGSAREIAIGGAKLKSASAPAAQPSALPTDGWKWVVGAKPNLAQENGRWGNEIFYKDGKGNWVKIRASAVRIAVGPKGSPYIVQKNNDIWRLEMEDANNVEKRWVKMPGKANDIGVGAGGSVWVIGTNPYGGGFGIFVWENNTWKEVGGAAVRIAVDPQGNPWVVNDNQDIFRREGGVNGKWVHMPGKAQDIGIGADGSVWVIATGAIPGGFNIFVWQNNAWKQTDGAAVGISVASDGNPWVVNSNGSVFRREGGVNGKWVHMPGTKASDIGAQ